MSDPVKESEPRSGAVIPGAVGSGAVSGGTTAPEAAVPGTPRSRRLEYDGPWKRVSPKYVSVEIVGSIVTGAVLSAVSLFFVLVVHAWFGWWMLGAALAILTVLVVVAPRRARAIGYQLRDDDLLFRQGIMFFRIVSVPYGRMQLIDVNRGPLDRVLGLSGLKFVTAAASTGVYIPGLPQAEADELRDRLVSLAESRRSGL